VVIIPLAILLGIGSVAAVIARRLGATRRLAILLGLLAVSLIVFLIWMNLACWDGEAAMYV